MVSRTKAGCYIPLVWLQTERGNTCVAEFYIYVQRTPISRAKDDGEVAPFSSINHKILIVHLFYLDTRYSMSKFKPNWLFHSNNDLDALVRVISIFYGTTIYFGGSNPI